MNSTSGGVAKPTALQGEIVQPWLRTLNWFFLLLVVVVTVALAVMVKVAPTEPAHAPARWFIFLVAIAAATVGMAFGFLYAPYGNESATFSSFTTAINGAVAGAAAADVARNDSIVRQFFRGLAAACGMSPPLVILLVVLIYVVIGFLFMYVNKRLLFDILQAFSAQQIADLQGQRRLINESVKITATEPGKVPQVPPEAQKAVEAIVASGMAGQDLSLDAIISDVKALFASNRLKDAESLLRKGLLQYPTNSNLRYYLSSVLASAGRQAEAIPQLESLTQTPGCPIEAWKLLGYCYLFAEGKSQEAADASRTYLNVRPDDMGAELNLVAALAAAGPNGPDRNEVIQKVNRLAVNPDAKKRLIDLTRPGEEFEAWREDTEFKALIQ